LYSNLSDTIKIQPVTGPIEGTIRPPGSKSITNRALLLAALAEGTSPLTGVLDSEDTRVMIQALQQLGVTVHSPSLSPSGSQTLSSGKTEATESNAELWIKGCGGRIPNLSANLFLENSGTSIRFLTAALAVAGGQYTLDGIERMRQRPIGPLVEALQSLGANIVASSPGQCPPVRIESPRIKGGAVQLDGSLSSQYLSGLLMAAPLAANGLEIEISGELVSQPYVKMTIEMMKSFGVQVSMPVSDRCFSIPGNRSYQGTSYSIEPDASAASYFWAAAAICGGRGTVVGLTPAALQGDVGFVQALQQMGCQVEYQADSITVVGPAKRGIEIDMSQISDTVQTLAAVALFVKGETTVTHVAHNRLKETDRIRDLATELRKLGADVREHPDGMTITPPDHLSDLQGATIHTYNDHRMAMSLSLAGLRIPQVVIADPKCVVKTYPHFFSDMSNFLRGA